MIYGYVSISSKGSFEAASLEEQAVLIKKHYPSATIISEEYDNPKDRPLLKGKIAEMQGGDTIVVSTLDRFCGTVKEALNLIEFAKSKSIRVNIINLGAIDNSPSGRNLVNMLNAMIEFDKAMMIERTQVGKAIAKTKEGFSEGRPKKYSDDEISSAIELLKTNSYKKVEEQTGISKSTLIRAKRKENKYI